MCIACSPGFRAAFQALSTPSRRTFLMGAGALVAEAAAPPAARADGGLGEILADGLGGAPVPAAAGPVTIFTAKKIITMDPHAADGTAVAVV